MKLSQFKFNLPKEQVALYPHSSDRVLTRSDGSTQTFTVTRRDEGRLMILHRKSGRIDMFKGDVKGEPKEEDFIRFKDVLDYFDEGDAFIFNDTKVFPARLYGTKEKTDAKIEVFLLRVGNKLFFDESGTMVAEVIDNTTSRGRTLRFLYDCPHDEFKRELYALGEAPLPRYIIDNRPKEKGAEFAHASADDMENFQSVFAKNEGAVSAPGTNIHFSEQMMKMMDIRGIKTAFITLHCGLGTFHDIEVEDLTKHKMDSEEMQINADACRIANCAKQAGHHLCAVGASVVKATETAVGTDGMMKEYDGWTNEFIFPPYNFGFADSMLVNFYHPYSTLLMETAAFGGYELVMEAYDKAVKNGYMFGCFGDSLLILDD